MTSAITNYLLVLLILLLLLLLCLGGKIPLTVQVVLFFIEMCYNKYRIVDDNPIHVCFATLIQ